MIGSFITRALVMVLGYAYPAYECYKTVEKNKPDIKQLQFWCQYWILVAFLTVCERVGDTFISWVPMYSEAKLAFFIYLWYPKTMGTTYIYDSFFKPYVAKHESEIDRNLLELRIRAGNIVVLYWHKAASYGQTRIFDILQFIAAQSTPSTLPKQTPQQGARVRQNSATNRQLIETLQAEVNEPQLSTSSTVASDDEDDSDDPDYIDEAAGPKNPPEPTVKDTKIPTEMASKMLPQTNNAEGASHSGATQVEAMQIEPETSRNEDANTAQQETIMQQVIRATTRARFRRSTPVNP